MKCFHHSFSIIILLILAMSGQVIAGFEANDTIEYTFYPCAIDSKQSSRLIANTHVKRKLAAAVAERLEQEGRLRDLRLAKDGATDLITSLVQVETVAEHWDGTGYTVTAKVAGGMDNILESVQLVRKDRHVEQDLILASRRVGTVLLQIEDFSHGHQESVTERLEMNRYYKSLDELEAVNGYTRGLVLLAGGHFNEAAHVLTESIQRDSDNVRLHHYRGVTYARMGRQSEALIDYERALALDCSFAPPHLGRAEILFAKGQMDKALEELRSAIAIDPSLTEAYLLRGTVYGVMGNSKHAIDDFTRAIALDPDLAIAHVYRGNVYGKMGYHRQAFTDYKRAIELDDTLWIAHFHSGALHERKRLYAKAHDAYSRVIELNAGCAIAYSNRGRVHSRLGEDEKALEDYDKAIDLDSTLAVAYFNRGRTHMKLGHVERALDDQRMAARLGWTAARDFLSAKGIKW